MQSTGYLCRVNFRMFARELERRADPEDARKVRIVLTSRARRLRAKLMPSVAEVNELALQGVSETDRATVRRVLAHMHRNLADAAV